MSGRRVTLRIADSSMAQTPLLSDKYNPLATVAVFGITAVIGAAFAIFGDDDVYRAIMGSVALAALSLLAALLALQGSMHYRGVRIDPRAAGLRFAAPAAVPVLFALTALLGLGPGAIVVTAMAAGMRQGGAIAFIALSLLAAGWTVQMLLSLRTPSGLTLTPDRIRGVRGSKGVDLAWAEIDCVEVVSAKGAQLVLRLRDGGSVSIDPRYTGSDPNVTVPLINYYLQHPEHRGKLSESRGALMFAEEELARK